MNGSAAQSPGKHTLNMLYYGSCSKCCCVTVSHLRIRGLYSQDSPLTLYVCSCGFLVMVLLKIACQTQSPCVSFDSVSLAEERGTRAICPSCGTRSWQKEIWLNQTNFIFSLRYELGRIFCTCCWLNNQHSQVQCQCSGKNALLGKGSQMGPSYKEGINVCEQC